MKKSKKAAPKRKRIVIRRRATLGELQVKHNIQPPAKPVERMCDACGVRPAHPMIELCEQCAKFNADYAIGDALLGYNSVEEAMDDTSHPGHPSNFGNN